ncbi:GNAT family N-acetyltransferase [Barrientosiimonas marina]|uniref:GNAT family N-acetyltransferase n=1 Tax=Lentibacillus kimchii TaxID=1542911 RepID=A0ABW2UWU5_9BACI
MTVKLESMDSDEFQQYLEYAIKNYADEHIKSGDWGEQEAFSKAKKEFEELLPEKENTENNYLFTICDNDEEVGMIWLAQRTKEEGFIFDINVWDGNKHKGYGEQAMKDLEIVGKEIGLKSIGLHVFGHNKIARNLYEKLGYTETNIKMKKVL